MAQVKFSRQARVCAKKRDLKEKSLQRKNDYGAERGARETPPIRRCITGCVRGKFAASPWRTSLTQHQSPALRCFAKPERNIFSKKENRHLRKGWGRGDSNSHAFQHMILSHARLPISTLPRCNGARSADTKPAAKPVTVHNSTGLAAEGILALGTRVSLSRP